MPLVLRSTPGWDRRGLWRPDAQLATERSALQQVDQDRADDALAKSALTYGVFLHLSGDVIHHGLCRRARDLMLDMTKYLRSIGKTTDARADADE